MSITKHKYAVLFACALVVSPGGGIWAQLLSEHLGGSITLSEARDRALSGNPELAAAGAAVRADMGAERRERAVPNPEIGFEAEDFGGDLPGWQEAQTTLTLSQQLEPPGVRKSRAQAAKYRRESSGQASAQRRIDLLADVERRFAELLGAQERARIEADNLKTAEEVSAAVSALVEAGEASPIENDRAQSELALARADSAAAKHEIEVARLGLSRLFGTPEPDFDLAEGDLLESVEIPALEDVSSVVMQIPQLKRAGLSVSTFESELALAKRARWPGPTLSFGRREYRATGEHAWVAGISLPIPLFDSGRGSVIEASAKLDQARFERHAEEVKLTTELKTAAIVLAQADGEARELRENIVPGATRVYDAINEGYRRGKFRLLDLLEARRTLAGARLRYIGALVRLNVAKAEIGRYLPARDQSNGENP